MREREEGGGEGMSEGGGEGMREREERYEREGGEEGDGVTHTCMMLPFHSHPPSFQQDGRTTVQGSSLQGVGKE